MSKSLRKIFAPARETVVVDRFHDYNLQGILNSFEGHTSGRRKEGLDIIDTIESSGAEDLSYLKGRVDSFNSGATRIREVNSFKLAKVSRIVGVFKVSVIFFDPDIYREDDLNKGGRVLLEVELANAGPEQLKSNYV